MSVNQGEQKNIGNPNSRLLRERYPNLFAEIDQEKTISEGLASKEEIENLTCDLSKKVWWKCSKHTGCDEHRWLITISNRTGIKNKGCPFCSGGGRRKCCKCSSFMNNPSFKLQFELAGDLNKGIDPWKISSGSRKELWWKCENHQTCDEHVWKTLVKCRSRGTGCPFCVKWGEKCCKCNSFMNDQYLKLQFELAGNLNKGINPWEISFGSGKKLWWKCENHQTCNEHVWQAMVCNRSSGLACPFCNNGGGCHKCCKCNSFMNNPSLKLQFELAGDLNKGINPWEISSGSNKELWWKCENHQVCDMHIWKARPNDRLNGRGCPFCSEGGSSKCCKCDSFMNNSVLKLQFELAGELNKGINPWEISFGSNKELWWKCETHQTCNMHIWKTSVNSRSRGCGCSFCSNNSGGHHYCCKCDSFMNNAQLAEYFMLAKEKGYNKNIDPWVLSKGSNVKLIWCCPNGKPNDEHIWESRIADRSDEHGCPKCARNQTESRGSKRLRDILNELKLVTIPECRAKEYLPRRSYDFYVEADKKIYEYDGVQHFKQTNMWHKDTADFLEKQNIDKLKNQVAILHGISIIRISNNNKTHIRRAINYFRSLEEKESFLGIDDPEKYKHMKDLVSLDLLQKHCPKYQELDKISPYLKNRIKVICLPLPDDQTQEPDESEPEEELG